ncbi:hypothetical protein CTA1_945 [Colletotrichum tanaceti]|uniref:Uncharacterized protein n=1 Tax=Colletotrichum tanaceti TaxID=1306861 RepID=A0A4U6XTL0_9PEZI|nr:hypothetical protein CTA1_945 [Colletotrichum tanaceti]
MLPTLHTTLPLPFLTLLSSGVCLSKTHYQPPCNLLPRRFEAAVEAYRSHISEHNRRIVQVYVSLVADVRLEEVDFEYDEDINELRAAAPGFTPWALCYIDGIESSGKPSQEEVALCKEWHLLAEKNLKTLWHTTVRESITSPGEFRTLAKSDKFQCPHWNRG